MKVLEDFRARNPELAADDLAQAAMERAILDIQTQDLRKLGFDPTRRQDGSAAAPGEIAIAHRNLRADPQVAPRLLTPETMLEQAKDKVVAWRGGRTGGGSPFAPGGDSQDENRAAAVASMKAQRIKQRGLNPDWLA